MSKNIIVSSGKKHKGGGHGCITGNFIGMKGFETLRKIMPQELGKPKKEKGYGRLNTSPVKKGGACIAPPSLKAEASIQT
jgi:hypothetical protein